MTHVLVTGGAGYIGSHICKALAVEGMTPITVDNLSRGHEELVRWGPLEVGDIQDTPWLCQVMDHYRPSAVIHCAGFSYVDESIKRPALYYTVNAGGTASLLNAMVEKRVRTIIFSSSCAVYGEPEKVPITEDMSCNPITPYGKSKRMAEQMIEDYARAYKLNHVCLRYFNAAGADAQGETGEWHEPETHVIPLILNAAYHGRSFNLYGTDYATHDGTTIRDYIHVTDLAKAHIQALSGAMWGDASGMYNVGAGQGASIRELVWVAEKVVGNTIRISEQERRSGDPERLVANISRIRKELDFVPMYSELTTIFETAWRWQQRLEQGRSEEVAS